MVQARGIRLVAIVALLIGTARSVRAQSQPPTASPTDLAGEESKRAQAKLRYEQGVDAYKKNRFKDAIDLFLEADQLAPSAALSFNIARAYEKIGDDSGGLRWYRDYLRRDPNAKNAADVKKTVGDLQLSLAKKGVQQITVLSSPPGATVAIDGRPVGVTPFTGEFPPGQHEVDFSLRGYADAQQQIDLGANEARDVVGKLERSTEPAAPPVLTPPTPQAPPPIAPAPTYPTEPARSGPKFGVLPYITMGAGAAALGGALVFEISRRSAESDAKKEPTQIGYQSKLDAMQSRQKTARILAGVGGALVLVGGSLFVIDLGSSRAKQTVTVGLKLEQSGYGLWAAGQL
jgi:tetratricopeptide (TPR) repeat protein